MGSIHSLLKHLPALTEYSAPLRSLLGKKNFVWTNECQLAFETLKKPVANIVELKHFDSQKNIQIVSDASQNESGAILPQLRSKWRPSSSVFQFLNTEEKKYSANKLEILAIVWGSEYFGN